MVSKIFLSCSEGKKSIYSYQGKWNYNKEIKALEDDFQKPDMKKDDLWVMWGKKTKQTVLPI